MFYVEMKPLALKYAIKLNITKIDKQIYNKKNFNISLVRFLRILL